MVSRIIGIINATDFGEMFEMSYSKNSESFNE